MNIEIKIIYSHEKEYNELNKFGWQKGYAEEYIVGKEHCIKYTLLRDKDMLNYDKIINLEKEYFDLKHRLNKEKNADLLISFFLILFLVFPFILYLNHCKKENEKIEKKNDPIKKQMEEISTEALNLQDKNYKLEISIKYHNDENKIKFGWQLIKTETVRYGRTSKVEYTYARNSNIENYKKLSSLEKEYDELNNQIKYVTGADPIFATLLFLMFIIPGAIYMIICTIKKSIIEDQNEACKKKMQKILKEIDNLPTENIQEKEETL